MSDLAPLQSASPPAPAAAPQSPAPTFSKAVRIGVGIAFLLACVPFAHRYFLSKEGREANAQLANIRAQFYPQLSAGWLRLSREDLRAVLHAKTYDMWKLVSVRAALVRWRLRALNPAPFDMLMDDYARGLWSAPPREEWEEEFRQFDQRWIVARSQVIAAGKATKPDRKPAVVPCTHANRAFARLMEYDLRGASNYAMGSTVRLVVDAPADSPIPTPPELTWTTFTAPNPYGAGRILATRHKVAGAPAGRQRWILDWDLSSEPSWMVDDARPKHLYFAAPGIERWSFLRVEFADAPHFAQLPSLPTVPDP